MFIGVVASGRINKKHDTYICSTAKINNKVFVSAKLFTNTFFINAMITVTWHLVCMLSHLRSAKRCIKLINLFYTRRKSDA